MLNSYKLYAGITLFCALASVTARAFAQGMPVAVVDGKTVSSADLDAYMGDRLAHLKTEEYNLRIAALHEYLDELLVLQEAQRRGITVPELLTIEVTQRTPPVTEAEARAVFENSPRSSQRYSDDRALQATTEDIGRRRTAKRQSEFVASLRQQHPPEIKLEPPRLTRSIGGGQSNRPAAPVSIVQFSDFQCPYCSALDTTLGRILKEYGPSVRLTAKQFPLPAHPQALKAAEAALCAGEQKRYWEMHQILFSSQSLVAQEAFEDLAKQAGVDAAAFKSCMAHHHFLGDVTHDMADAKAVGVNSTPTLFINGVMVVGAKPYEALKDIIDSELRHTQR
jgi:protein-disulfide isomerase